MIQNKTNLIHPEVTLKRLLSAERSSSFLWLNNISADAVADSHPASNNNEQDGKTAFVDYQSDIPTWLNQFKSSGLLKV